MFGFGSKTIVGLDVGSSSIKAVELKKGRNGIEVAHLGLEPLAPDIVVDSIADLCGLDPQIVGEPSVTAGI